MKIDRMSFTAMLVMALGALALAGCDDDTDVPQPEAEAEATVHVVHGIDGTDPGADEALAVDVAVSGVGCVLEDVRFRDVVQSAADDGRRKVSPRPTSGRGTPGRREAGHGAQGPMRFSPDPPPCDPPAPTTSSRRDLPHPPGV